MMRINFFLKKHLFLILLCLAGTFLTGFFGLITGAIAGALLDQLIFRMKNREQNSESSQKNQQISKEKEIREEDYLILGVNPETPPEEIKKTYYKLASQFHPDSTANLSPEQKHSSEEAFKKIQAAYERVSGKKY